MVKEVLTDAHVWSGAIPSLQVCFIPKSVALRLINAATVILLPLLQNRPRTPDTVHIQIRLFELDDDVAAASLQLDCMRHSFQWGSRGKERGTETHAHTCTRSRSPYHKHEILFPVYEIVCYPRYPQALKGSCWNSPS